VQLDARARPDRVRAELHARIESVFDGDTDRQYGLERAQQEIEDLLGLLGVPVPTSAGTVAA
jgi:hypothetical protein